MTTTRTRRQSVCRWMFYFLGFMVMSAGIMVSANCDLGISPLTSLPFAFSKALSLPFSVMSFAFYVALIASQFIIRGKKRTTKDLLQLPVALLFSALLGVFENAIVFELHTLPERILVLFLSLLLMGTGGIMIIHMRLIPCPTDGLMDAVSQRFCIDLGLSKNICDAVCVMITCVVDLVSAGRITSVGLGTVITMILMGRVIYLCNRLFKKKLQRLAGVSDDMRK